MPFTRQREAFAPWCSSAHAHRADHWHASQALSGRCASRRPERQHPQHWFAPSRDRKRVRRGLVRLDDSPRSRRRLLQFSRTIRKRMVIRHHTSLPVGSVLQQQVPAFPW